MELTVSLKTHIELLFNILETLCKGADVFGTNALEMGVPTQGVSDALGALGYLKNTTSDDVYSFLNDRPELTSEGRELLKKVVQALDQVIGDIAVNYPKINKLMRVAEQRGKDLEWTTT